MLISEEYKALQVKAHEDRPEWGQAATNNLKAIMSFCEFSKATHLLDYGCGKQRLRDALKPHGITVTGYDPGIPGLDDKAEPSDFVVCADVLEHIEPQYLSDVLDDLRRVTRKAGIFTVSTVPARMVLADGTNAHRIIKPTGWWLEQLCRKFSTYLFDENKAGFGVVVQ